MPELEVSSGSFLSQIVALDLTIRPSKKSLAAGAAKLPCKERNFSIIAPSSVTASPCHLPPKGKAFKGSPLIPPFGGTFPPGEGFAGEAPGAPFPDGKA